MKRRLIEAPYEICMARARYFTESYRETKGQNPALRNALALRRTLEKQRIFIYPDEQMAGSKTERFLAGPLSVERGDYLRALQLEMDILERKKRPFKISDGDRRLFWREILPYWDGRTVRDDKARRWLRRGIVRRDRSPRALLRSLWDGLRLARYLGPTALGEAFGGSLRGTPTLRRLRNLYAMRNEFVFNNPTPAVYCFDIQGHLCLGVDQVVREGMEAIAGRAQHRLERLRAEEPGDRRGHAFLEAVVISLESAMAYAVRFADLAGELADVAQDPVEEARLRRISETCRRVPRHRPRTFFEALQAAWMTCVVGEIQYGTLDVFAQGRVDQFLNPFLRKDLESGAITREEATALLQEYLLRLSANVMPVPEVGMETNAVLGTSQHTVVIGGVTPDGEDAVNELSWLFLDAFEQLGGTVNQLCVRLHTNTTPTFVRRAVEVFRRSSGISFFNDEAIVPALEADGLDRAAARDYCIIGCVETSGQSDTHGCPGGHDLVLPAVLLLALTDGRFPPPAPGQHPGHRSGDPRGIRCFEDLLAAFQRQLAHQVSLLVAATAAKDEAHLDLLPAPYVSALMADCIERARDLTDGGARYDFTGVILRGLATLVDSLLAIDTFVFRRQELSMAQLIKAILDDYRDQEALRWRLIREAPKYGTGDPEADALTLRVVEMIHQLLAGRRNARGGRYRAAYYSYGNHVIDGFLLGATPDGRRRGTPISNGVSPSNLVEPPGGPIGALRSVAAFPPDQVSCGLALNLRFHPSFIANKAKLETFAAMLLTYFAMGGMQLQPTIVSTEVLRAAQRDPGAHRDLVVKVSGYSAYFTDLGRSIQEDIIARAEFR